MIDYNDRVKVLNRLVKIRLSVGLCDTCKKISVSLNDKLGLDECSSGCVRNITPFFEFEYSMKLNELLADKLGDFIDMYETFVENREVV